MNRILENEELLIEAAERGGELVRLYDKTKDRDLLWNGDPVHWGYHSPVLFPFVGKVAEGVFRYKGKTYPMGQHGFARTSEFRCVSEQADRLVFALDSDAATKEKYPFDFHLEVSYVLKGRTLEVGWHVYNPSSLEPLYFQIGAHPAFRVPLVGNGEKKDYFIEFHDQKAPEYILIDLQAGAADPTQAYRMETEDGYLPLKEHLFDIDTFIFEGGQIRNISLCTPQKERYVTIRCNGFPYFGIWSPSDQAPFVCLEPWQGRLDDRGFAGELPEKTGINCLEPKENRGWSYEIEVP